MLTYIGFDGISTLSEECDNPRANVLIATVLTCLIVGVLSIWKSTPAQLVWPSSERFPTWIRTSPSWLNRAWPPLFAVVASRDVESHGHCDGSTVGVARLLYGMGRSGALPSFFGAIYAKPQVPAINVLFVWRLHLDRSADLPAVSGNSTGYELGEISVISVR